MFLLFSWLPWLGEVSWLRRKLYDCPILSSDLKRSLETSLSVGIYMICRKCLLREPPWLGEVSWLRRRLYDCPILHQT
jgi:hypothetical protein